MEKKRKEIRVSVWICQRSFSSPFIIPKVFQWALKKTLPPRNWARLSTRAVYCSVGWRVSGWNEAASGASSANQQPGRPPVSHIIPHTSVIFRRQSSLWKPHSAAAPDIYLCASAEPGGNNLVFTDVWLGKPASLPCNVFIKAKLSNLSLSLCIST